jgi:drug/metabolite transporter (DMT)-like permease
MARDRTLLTGTLAAIVGASLFGMLGALSRFGAEAGVTGVAFTAWRAVLGAILLAVLITVRGEAGASMLELRRLDRRGRLMLLLAGTMGVVLNASMFTAFSMVPIALALMLFYLYPVGVAAVDVIAGHERVTPSRLLALFLSLVGVALVLLGSMGGGAAAPIDPLGIVLGLVAAVSQVVFIAVSRAGYRAVPAPAATLVVLLVSIVGASSLALLVGQADGMVAPFRNPAAWPPLLLAGVAGAGVSSLLLLVAIRLIGGTRTGILMLLEPVVGVLLAGLWLGEALGPVQAIGGVLVLAGALVLQLGSGPGHETVVESATGPVI